MNRYIIINGKLYKIDDNFNYPDLSKIAGRIRIISPYNHKEVTLIYEECNENETHIVYVPNQDSIVRINCILKGIDSVTREKWVITPFRNWYKEYTMKYPNETNACIYYNKYTGRKSIVEWHFCKNTLISAEGYNGDRITVTTTVIGRDITTLDTMVYSSGNWYKVIDSGKNTRDDDNKQSEENANEAHTYKFSSIYDGHTITIKIIELPNPVKLYIFYDEYHTMLIESNIIGIDTESNQIWAFYCEDWYRVSMKTNKVLEYINKFMNYKVDKSNKKDGIKNETENVQQTNKEDKSCKAWHVDSTKKYIFSVKSIMSNMAKWIYSLDPINHSTNYLVHKIYIPEILHLLYMNLIKDGRKLEVPADEDFYYFEYTKEELRKYLYSLVYEGSKTKDLFSKLNLSYNEMKNGIEVSDPNRNIINLSSRFSGPKWEDDFIDLDALINNVVLECVKDAVAAE